MMSSPDFKMELKAQVLQKDLEAYRKLETWGASLFLGAIALLGKQLIEWDRAVDVADRVTLEASSFGAPAIVGMVAFVFLRVVNFRVNRTSLALRDMVGESLPSTRTSWGILGLLLALMPLALGYAIFWLLVHDNATRRAAVSWLWLPGAFVVLFGLVTHVVMRWRSRHRNH